MARNPSFIYWLLDAGNEIVKLGRCKDAEELVNVRLKSHRTSNPTIRFLFAVEGDSNAETQIKKFYKDQAVNNGGENLRLNDHLRDYLSWVGEQPWAACSVEEVLSPFGHFPHPNRHPYEWEWRKREAPKAAAVSQLEMFPVDKREELCGILMPLPAEQRLSSFARDSNDWYTPVMYVESARRVMGGIDLDPASCFFANQIVQAAEIYTEAEDGVCAVNRWHGRVWLNPPYQGQAAPFAHRLIAEYDKGNVQQGIMLLNSWSNSAKWFHPCFRFPICWSGRIAFIGGGPAVVAQMDESGAKKSPQNGSCFVYVGPNVDQFVAEFSKYGHITPPALNATSPSACALMDEVEPPLEEAA